MQEPTIILGGGLAGLSAAYHSQKLKLPYLLFEKEARPGGLVRSENVKGYTFDYTGHLLHLAQPRTQRLVLKELGLKKAFAPVKRDSWVYSQGVYTRAPYQANAFGLPPHIIKENVDGFLQAWAEDKAAKPGEMLSGWALRNLGAGIYKNFFKPYNTKLWGISPEKMTTEWMGRFVPRPDLKRVLQGALEDQGEALGYNANFIYPRKGGIETLVKGFIAKVACRCSAPAVKIRLKDRIVEFSDGGKVSFDKLITSLPLSKLIQLIDKKPAAVAAAAKKLRASSVYNINLGFKRNISDKQWIYVPEESLPFYRVGFYHNFSKDLVPKGGSSVYVEVSTSKDRPVNKKAIQGQVLKGLRSMGLLKTGEKPAASWVAEIKDAYVQYDVHREKAVETILTWLNKQNIHSVGRWGRWEYSSMEDAIWQGAQAAGWKEKA